MIETKQKLKVKSVTIEEIHNDNPTGCMSALRVFNACHTCTKYINAYYGDRVNKLECKPRINPKIEKLLTEKKRLTQRTHQRVLKINSKIQKLEN